MTSGIASPTQDQPDGAPKPDPKVVKLRTPDARVSALGIARATSRDIERGRYAPGAPLREQELARAFGCSRAPVREALRILESQGMVVIEPMRGARVATVNDAQFYEVFLIRRALAGLMAQQAAQAPNSPAKADFIGEARKLEALATAGADTDAFARQVRRAIQGLITIADTPRTVQIVRSITFGHEAFQTAGFPTQRDRVRNAACWTRLADAIDAGNANRARDAIEKLFDFTMSRIVRDQK